MNLRESLTTKKEVPSGWLFTFLIGGISNLVILVWMASAVVSDVTNLKTVVTDIRAVAVANAAEVKSLDVTTATHNAQIIDHDYRLKRLEKK